MNHLFSEFTFFYPVVSEIVATLGVILRGAVLLICVLILRDLRIAARNDGQVVRWLVHVFAAVLVYQVVDLVDVLPSFISGSVFFHLGRFTVFLPLAYLLVACARFWLALRVKGSPRINATTR